MIKGRVKEERGITLVALVIAITILMIMVDVIVYNLKDRLEVENLKEMQTDIENLSDKISAYYAQYGKIPASIEYDRDSPEIQKIEVKGIISKEVDTGRFLVIDLSAIENLTLNRGRDFEEIKKKANDNESNKLVNGYGDLYIINETSHNIFYVAGVEMNGETYYTNYNSENTREKESVDLKYKDGVKIPDGFQYIEIEKEGIFIKSDKSENEIYKWIPVKDKWTKISEELNVTIQDSEREAFIKSVNAYQGYYTQEPPSEETNKVVYLPIYDNWSPSYDEEGVYKDKNGDTAYIPKGFQVSQIPGENTIEEGLVVKDSNDNEWVWIEVPKSIYTTAESSDDYENIEKDMQIYVSAYKNERCNDVWHSKEQHGFASENEYNSFKNKMLKSVYENGGFYVGRYEAGTRTFRTSALEELTEPIIQRGTYPYNYITCKQAQEKSRELISDKERTSSLMFGIQWDLIMKFIEQKGAKTQTQLKTDSSTWGNYNNVEFNFVRGKYSYDMGTTFSSDVNNKTSKVESTSVLLTTGATDRNSALNIYDLAGNLWEWTLQHIENPEKPCGIRGGYCCNYGQYCPAAAYNGYSEAEATSDAGFRPCLW